MAQRTVQNHNRMVLDSLEEGDLIAIHRSLKYDHWAVYDGDGHVIHLTGIGDNSHVGHSISVSGVLHNMAVVRRDKFWTVVDNCRATKNNSKDETYRKFEAVDIVKRARGVIGPYTYNILWNNCEHFASWCRYGLAISEQIETIIARGVIVGSCAVIGLLVVSWYQKGKKTKTEELEEEEEEEEEEQQQQQQQQQ